MALINPMELVRDAFRNGWAVPAINTQGGNYDLVRSLVETAAEERSALILQAYEVNTAYYGLGLLPYLAEKLSRDFGIPLMVHLDHGKSVETALKALDLGYTSVMIDYSHLPLERNIEATKTVLAAARGKGAAVEAELGRLKRAGEAAAAGKDEEDLAEPEEVERFLEETGVDLLAVGIGNAHGFYKTEPNIRVDLLKRIRERSGETPLVLHGTTGIPEPVVRECVRNGMAKVNYGTIIKSRMLEHFKRNLDGSFDHGGNFWRVCEEVRTRLKDDIRPILRLLDSSGRV